MILDLGEIKFFNVLRLTKNFNVYCFYDILQVSYFIYE